MYDLTMKKLRFLFLTIWLSLNLTLGLILSTNLAGVEKVNAQDAYMLTVDIIGSGSVTLNPDKVIYQYGDVVLLTAFPDTGWQFSGWSGDISGSRTQNPKLITMNRDRIVTATFTQNEYTLTVNTVGSGSVTRSPNQETYHYGDPVQLTANAATGWSFSDWSGDLSGSSNPEYITMNGDETVTATFTQNEYTLTVNTVGSGSVTRSPNQETYHYGESVQLTANAATGWSFSGWSGDLYGSFNPVSITMDENKTVTAIFTQEEYSVTVTVNPSEGGSVSPDTTGVVYHYNDVVTLTPTANPGYTFSGWSGDGTNGGGDTRVVTVTNNMDVTAIFTQDEYTLTVNTVGSGSVNFNPVQDSYHYGDVVSLEANADTGWTFYGWIGDLTGSNNPDSITILGDTSVTATFTQNVYTLTVNIEGSGSVIKNPDQTTYNYGEIVQLTADAAEGWTFSGWSGDLSGSRDNEFIIMNGNKAVIATFTQNVYTLTVNIEGSGSVIKNPDQTTYNYGEIVQLTADAAEGWTFDHWELDSTNVGNENPYTATINDDHTLTAVFKDITLPKITVTSPLNETYSSSDISLKFSVDKATSWIRYSLDAQSNITISGNTTISGLSEGSHSIVVYVNDTLGNTGVSERIDFQVDTTPPTITIISPQETSYSTSEITLNFTLNEPVTWTAYTLDSEENVTITNPVIISGLSVGSHNIIVFANDTAGNTGSSDVIQFIVSTAAIDTTPPTVIVNSPTNTTYDTNQISLSFTVSEEPTLKFYSLDGKANTTVVDPIVISDLSDGEHRLIMYAEDLAGNIGVSKVVVFTITSENDNSSQLWVVGVIGLIAGAGFIFSAYIANDLLKSRRRKV